MTESIDWRKSNATHTMLLDRFGLYISRWSILYNPINWLVQVKCYYWHITWLLWICAPQLNSATQMLLILCCLIDLDCASHDYIYWMKKHSIHPNQLTSASQMLLILCYLIGMDLCKSWWWLLNKQARYIT